MKVSTNWFRSPADNRQGSKHRAAVNAPLVRNSQRPRRLAFLLLLACATLTCLPVSAQRNFRWTRMNTTDTFLDVAGIDSRWMPWVTRSDGSVGYVETSYSGARFVPVPASGFSRMAMGPNDTLWAVGFNGTIWTYQYGRWDLMLTDDPVVRTKGVADVAWGPVNGRGAHAWLVLNDGTVHHFRDGTSWGTGPDRVKSLAVDTDYNVWAVDSDGILSIHRPWTTVPIPLASGMNDIAVGPNRIVWLTGEDGIVRFTRIGHGITQVASPLHVAHAGDVLGGGRPRVTPIRFRRIAANAVGQVWAVGTDGSLWRLSYDA